MCKRQSRRHKCRLLNAGADCSTVNSSGETCLHYAVLGKCTEEIFHAIIDQGVDVNGANGDKQTPLMTACQVGNVDAINILLKAGADTSSASDIHGATCIHHAVDGDCSKTTLQAIINHGADVNATNRNNVTALMLACEKRNAETINGLLNARADCSIVDAIGEACLHYAVRNSCKGNVLHTVISYGADVNARNKRNVTALLIACEKGNVEAINVLLNAGADPNIVDINCDTCLHSAVRGHCSKEVLQELIDLGVDVNARNKKFATAIVIACKQGVAKKENKDAIHVLLNAGADLTLTLHHYVLIAINIHHNFGQSYAKEVLKQMFVKT